jgi:hypothetical protein
MEVIEIEIEKKKREVQRIFDKYPNRVPLILRTNLKLSQKKFLVHDNMTLACFVYLLRTKYLKLMPSQSLYIFFDELIINSQKTFKDIYATYKSSDNYLYADIVLENSFG